MTRLAEFCMLAHGWRRAIVMLFAGAIAGLSVPPLFVLPGLFFALPLWVWALDGAERIQDSQHGWQRLTGAAFSIGFWFGLGYFLVALHWIGAAFFVDGGWLLALMPFAVLILSACMALFWGFASAVAHIYWHPGAWRLLSLAIMLTGAEFLRGHILSGFPFALPGYALTANDTMMQATSFIGVYGLTFIVILLAATPALVWPADKRALSRRLAPLFLALMVIAAQLGFGTQRLDSAPTDMRDDVRLRLVQPNIAQADKWQADNADFVLARLLEISQTHTGPDNSGLLSVTHLIWPESAFPFYLLEHPEALARIARMLPAETLLLTGAPRLDPEFDKAYNSILAINNLGEIVSRYDKTHLVPFGEFLPLASLWEGLGLKQFVPGNEGWHPGETRRLMQPPATPAFLPLICYEALFSGDLGAEIAGAEFILNLTNDGWFDGSIGPAQHFHHVRVRAVEEGKPLVRVANTGRSAVIDPFGRLTAIIPQGQLGLIDADLPQSISPPLFVQWRHWPLLLTMIFGFVALTIRGRRPDPVPDFD